jgi:hypothetical protein
MPWDQRTVLPNHPSRQSAKGPRLSGHVLPCPSVAKPSTFIVPFVGEIATIRFRHIDRSYNA